MKIQARAFSCRCGCHGQDPWHKPNYNRVIRDIVEVAATANTGDSAQQVVVARGMATFPWGVEPVVAMVWSFDGKLHTNRDWQLETIKR